MTRTRSGFVIAMALVASRVALPVHAKQTQENPTLATATIEPTLESFASNYTYPDWFRDANLGLWSHRGPQAMPMMGDWYARHRYVEGDPQQNHHLETFGHPTKHGFKDIIPRWKAEKRILNGPDSDRLEAGERATDHADSSCRLRRLLQS